MCAVPCSRRVKPNFNMTWTDPLDGVVHAWGHIATWPGEAAMLCGEHVRNAFTHPGTSRHPTRATCIICLANPHDYALVPRRGLRLDDDPWLDDG